MCSNCLTVVSVEDAIDDRVTAAGDEHQYLRKDVEVKKRPSFLGIGICPIARQSALRNAQRHELGHVIGHLTDDEDDDDGEYRPSHRPVHPRSTRGKVRPNGGRGRRRHSTRDFDQRTDASQEEYVEDGNDDQRNGESDDHLDRDPGLPEEKTIGRGPADPAAASSVGSRRAMGVAEDPVGRAAQ